MTHTTWFELLQILLVFCGLLCSIWCFHNAMTDWIAVRWGAKSGAMRAAAWKDVRSEFGRIAVLLFFLLLALLVAAAPPYQGSFRWSRFLLRAVFMISLALTAVNSILDVRVRKIILQRLQQETTDAEDRAEQELEKP